MAKMSGGEVAQGELGLGKQSPSLGINNTITSTSTHSNGDVSRHLRRVNIYTTRPQKIEQPRRCRLDINTARARTHVAVGWTVKVGSFG